MQVIDLALQAGRQLQKAQTGFVHYYYQSKDLTTHDTIPTLENALFALSLFRSRIADHVLEGKAIIEKLLSFELEGNFPVYLHEYPNRYDPYLGLRILPIFFWLLIDFSHVMGELKLILENCIDRIIAKASVLDLPEWAQFRLKAFEGKIGELPQTLFSWSQGLISLQIGEKKGALIEGAIAQACQVWHPTLCMYIGPALRRHQEGTAPELTVFDLYMCQWQKVFPKRACDPRPIHLHGALIRPLSFELPLVEKSVPYIHFEPKEECPLLIAWSEHTFILEKKHLQVEGNAQELLLHFSEAEDDMAVNFYLNYHPDHEILVNDQKATTFQQEDEVEIHSKGIRIALKFLAEDGHYCGHLMRGNRPSQHYCKGEHQFAAYDWRITIRIISKGKCPMRVHLRVLEQKLESPQPLPLHASHYLHTE